MIINFEKSLKRIESSDSGTLSVMEANRDFPFEIKRIYYTYDVPKNIKRGMHAHKELQQVIWCPYGAIKVIMDNGFQTSTHLLDSPEKILYVSEGHWHEMIWEIDGSVLCAAASDYYNEEDYIRNYDEFLKFAKSGYWADQKL